MIKTIIFDFDGTIADTFSITLKCGNKLCEEFNTKKVKDSKSLRDKSMRRIVTEDMKLPFYKLPSYVKKIKLLLNREIDNIPLFEGILKTIEALKKKYKIMILTSNSKENIKHILNKENLKVDSIFSDSSIFGKHKVIKKLLKEYNLEKEEIIYVGDEIRDIEACKKIGVKIISVTWGYNSKESLEKENPDYLVDKPKELLDLMAKIKV